MEDESIFIPIFIFLSSDNTVKECPHSDSDMSFFKPVPKTEIFTLLSLYSYLMLITEFTK
jgi:hypothetical protein